MLYKTEFSLRRTLSACPKGVRLRESWSYTQIFALGRTKKGSGKREWLVKRLGATDRGKEKKERHNALSPVFSFPAALHLATVLISDALRVRASSSYYSLDTPPQVRLSIFETKMAIRNGLYISPLFRRSYGIGNCELPINKQANEHSQAWKRCWHAIRLYLLLRLIVISH